MITEIVTFQLKASANLSDSTSPTTQAIRRSLSVVLDKSEAPSAYYGQPKDKPDTVVLFVNWPSNDEHEQFKSSPSYQEHFGHMIAVIDTEKPITVLNVPFTPLDDPSPALGANGKVGITELIVLYIASSASPVDKDAISSSVDKMKPLMKRSGKLEVCGGWALEDSIPNPAPQPGEEDKCLVHVSLGGWVDAQSHSQSQGSEKIQQSIEDLQQSKSVKHIMSELVKFHAM